MHGITIAAAAPALIAAALTAGAGPAAASERLQCGDEFGWRYRISAPGMTGCVSHTGTWVAADGTTRIRVTYSVKDAKWDHHCAYLHARARFHGWGRAVAKTCGVGTVTTVSRTYRVGAYGRQTIRFRGHRGHGPWSAIKAVSFDGAH
jgi:hypothetical protein